MDVLKASELYTVKGVSGIFGYMHIAMLFKLENVIGKSH